MVSPVRFRPVAGWIGGQRTAFWGLDNSSVCGLESCYYLRLHRRSFAFPDKWKRKPQKPKTVEGKFPTRNSKGRSKNGSSQEARRKSVRLQAQVPPVTQVTSKKDRREVQLPLMIRSTASQNVFIAEAALHVNPDIDPQELFKRSDLNQSSFGFQSSAPQKEVFQYFPPSYFQHELPEDDIPEVAILGRSNVGKSSLINALIGQKLALSSKVPGRTQQVFYYGWLNNKPSTPQNAGQVLSKGRVPVKGYIVDMPGYGYAKGPDAAIEEWQKTSQNFLISRRDSGQLQRLFLLIDARHGANQLDHSVMNWFTEAEIPYSLVLTKSDASTRPMVVKHANLLGMRYQQEVELGHENDETSFLSPVVHITSAKSQLGLHELMYSIETEFSTQIDQ